MSRPRRHKLWFDNPDNPSMTALYLERYLNYGLTIEELRSDRPIIGIAQTGSDLSPCNRVHLRLAERVREGIRAAGGIAFEFPVHPIQETGRRPTAALDRNLTYLGLGYAVQNEQDPAAHVDISPLAGLTKLTSLQMGGVVIDDLSAVSGLQNLISLTVFNGEQALDLTPLAGLKNLHAQHHPRG